jgi:hypothetical protein
MNVLGGGHEGRQELARLDGVGEGREQIEGSELAAQQRQALPVGREYPQGVRSALGYLAEQLQAGAVGEPFAGDDDLELGFAQQVDAIGLVGEYVDRELAGQRPHERFQHGGILIDDEDAHDDRLDNPPDVRRARR